MSFDRLRVYDADRFHDTELPDWHDAAVRLCETEHLDWHRALERALDCEHRLLTEDGMLGGAFEIGFWPSEIVRRSDILRSFTADERGDRACPENSLWDIDFAHAGSGVQAGNTRGSRSQSWHLAQDNSVATRDL